MGRGVGRFALLPAEFAVLCLLHDGRGGWRSLPYRYARSYGTELLAPVPCHYRSGTVADISRRDALREPANRYLCKLGCGAAQPFGRSEDGRIRFLKGCRRLDYFRSPDHDSGGLALSSLRAIPVAAGFIAAEHHAAGNDYLVGVLSNAGFGAMVLDQISPATDFSYPRVFGDALNGLLSLSGQRGHGIPAAGAASGLLFYLCRGRLCADAGEKRGA